MIIKKERYVCGFCFDLKREYVGLVNKKRPEWQKGLFNGIGGKIEEGEESLKAMQREFLEETGVEINDWDLFYYSFGGDYELFFFRAFNDDVFKISSKTDEFIVPALIRALNNNNKMGYDQNKTIEDLKILIPMALEL